MRWEQWKRWQRRRRKFRDTRNLIVGLVSSDPAQRYASELVLLELGPEGVSLLLSELNLMGNMFRQLPATLGWTIAASCVVNYIWLLYGGPLLATFLPALGVLMVLIWQSRRNRNATARLLAQVEDRRIVGPLTEALDYGDAVTRDAARQCLLRVLPQFAAADAYKLEARHRRRLNRVLSSEDEPLILAVLQALPRIGDSNSIAPVEYLIRHPQSQKIRRAATECLPLLTQRIEELRISGTLLRPSSDAETAPEMLLRPVYFDPDYDSRDLLRTIFHEE
jgi:hypothetical protein